MSQSNATAIVIGTGAIGQALVAGLQGRYSQVLALGRRSAPAINFQNEASIEQAALWSAGQCESAAAPLRLLLVTSGFLHGAAGQPERSLKDLNPGYLAHSFLVNALGPALLMKHFLPLLSRQDVSKAVFLSARVGSIADNRLGGWYGYRAAKAALNQLVKTASIEQSRRNRLSCVLALHPGTVDSPLSAPFGKSGLDVRSPAEAAGQILQVIDGLGPADTGSFVDYQGEAVPW